MPCGEVAPPSASAPPSPLEAPIAQLITHESLPFLKTHVFPGQRWVFMHSVICCGVGRLHESAPASMGTDGAAEVLPSLDASPLEMRAPHAPASVAPALGALGPSFLHPCTSSTICCSHGLSQMAASSHMPCSL